MVSLSFLIGRCKRFASLLVIAVQELPKSMYELEGMLLMRIFLKNLLFGESDMVLPSQATGFVTIFFFTGQSTSQ